MIKLSNVSYSFGELEVFKNLYFTVQDDEFLAVVGPSGCGKTTLLLLLSGLYTPNEGEIEIAIEQRRENRVKMGLVFQEYNKVLLSWRKVISNVALGLELNKVPKKIRMEAARDYLKLVGLEKASEMYPFQLSGGMKQRVQIARVMALNPSVLLMDEPLGALDAHTKTNMQDFLLSLLRKEKKTILYVTHDVDEAVYLADRIIVLSSRPSTVVYETKVNLPERTHDTRTSREFIELRETIWSKLPKV